MSAYDATAPSFERYRALPERVPAAIRGVILDALFPSARLLDIGAGTGRIGLSFVAAGDDYVGMDLSFGMLSEFARRAGRDGWSSSRLVQADGTRLPFCAATFDAVMLIQMFGGMGE